MSVSCRESNCKLNESNVSETLSNIRPKLISQVKDEFSSVFLDNSNSFITDFKAVFKVKDGVKSIFHRAYEMPYALKPKVEEELHKMVTSGVSTKIKVIGQVLLSLFQRRI